MTKAQFLPIMAMIESAGKEALTDEGTETYWSLLGDLPIDVMRMAAKLVLLRHPWPSFPSIQELRTAASEAISGDIADMTPERAWGIAWATAGKLSFDTPSNTYWAQGKMWPSQLAYVMSTVPPMVARAMSHFGLHALAHGKEPISVIRGQFLKCFEQVVHERRRLALMPAALIKEIQAKQAELLPESPPAAALPAAAKAVNAIGLEK
jgi:hypothetical protein